MKTDLEVSKADKFFSRITFYNENLEKYFKGYEKNYQFGFVKGERGEKTTCLIINDDEGYFRGIITFTPYGNHPHHIYNQEGKEIGSYCWNNELCVIQEDGSHPKDGIEFLLRKTEQIRDDKYRRSH